MDWALIAKISAFVLYLGAMVYVGLKTAGKNNTSSDFFLGGRNVGPWVTALSAEASDSSAWLLMGLPGLCYLGGIKETFWTALGLCVGTYISWLFIAKPLRKCSVTFGDSITIPEFFKNRLNDRSNLLSVISVVFIIFFFTIYTASGFVACAKLFNSVFGMPYHAGLLIGLVVILAYTVMGGYTAVCTTDFIQGTLIIVAIVVSGVIAVISLGGPVAAYQSVQSFDARALAGSFGETIKNAFKNNQNYSVMNIISALAWGLGYLGMPHIIVRFMGIDSAESIPKARRIGISWMVISYIGTFVLGTVGTAFLLKHGTILGLDPNTVVEGVTHTGDAETIFSETILNIYPAFFAGVFLCAILAASMSTADSQLLAAASAVGQDIYKGIIKKDASEKQILVVSRVTVILITVIALFLSLNPNSSIFGLVSYAWAGFGATFGPLVLLALYWRGLTAKGAIAGLIGGGIVVVAWHQLSGGIFELYEIVPGFVVCLVLAVVISLLTKKDETILARFDEYKKA